MKSNERAKLASNHLRVMEAIYSDSSMRCPAECSDIRDLITIRSRVKHEGISFLTITLPEFARDFERSLSQGQVDSTAFRNFRKVGAIPSFLKGMLSRMFDVESGRILDDPSNDIHSSDISTLVDCVRQICLAFKKIEIPCSEKRIKDSLRSFIETEQSFEMHTLSGEDVAEFNSVVSCVWDNIVGVIRPDMLVPRHGPGATSERVSGNQKYAWKYWHERLEGYFPLLDNAYTISAYEDEAFENVRYLTIKDEIPVRVTPVPKTLKGPRIIAIEPSCMQYTQQAIRDVLYRLIENSWMTKGHVNFRDQSINQSMALSASKDRSFATIDLSDASDRVPYELGLSMFNCNEFLLGAVDACRSRFAEMPDRDKTRVGPLRKFASMGSALCFPVESMYFYTICIAALLRKYDLPVTIRNCYNVSRGIYIYGDDIVVPTDDAGAVLDYLQKYNCKVNRNKTFYTGKFRESCGVDAYDGYEVTPVYVRKPQPESRRQVSELISWVSTANQFYRKGYWRTCFHMFSICEEILGPLPYVSEYSSALGRISALGVHFDDQKSRWNPDIQVSEIRSWVVAPVHRTDVIDGYAALTKSLSQCGGSDSHIDKRHLERSALHGTASLKRRWVNPS